MIHPGEKSTHPRKYIYVPIHPKGQKAKKQILFAFFCCEAKDHSFV